MNPDLHFKLLKTIESKPSISQRELAKELGVEIGEVVAISESGGNMPIPVMRADTFAKEMSLSLPGQESVNARVNVTFTINQ